MIYSWIWISNHFEVRMSDWECFILLVQKLVFQNSTFYKKCHLDLNMYISNCIHVRWLYSVHTFLFTCKVSNICQIIQSHVPSFFHKLTKLIYLLTYSFIKFLSWSLSFILTFWEFDLRILKVGLTEILYIMSHMHYLSYSNF